MKNRTSKTVFPKFNLDDPSEEGSCNQDESISIGSDDEFAKYVNKEDQDVAVFMRLIEKMSVNSLLFILQNHAREMNNISDSKLRKALVVSRREQNKIEKKTPESLHKIKKFRFAEIMGGTKIREEVFEIPHVAEMTDEEKELLWWNRDDQHRMREQARKTIKFFRKRRPEYVDAVKFLAESYLFEEDDKRLIETKIKHMARDSFPRGLEYHIVDELGDCRNESLLAVLEEQAERHFNSSDAAADHDAYIEMIRQTYRQASLPCRTFALKIAQSDHIEALKSSLSRTGA